MRPQPFIDPDRLVWEMAIVKAYADCRKRHRATVKAVG